MESSRCQIRCKAAFVCALMVLSRFRWARDGPPNGIGASRVTPPRADGDIGAPAAFAAMSAMACARSCASRSACGGTVNNADGTCAEPPDAGAPPPLGSSSGEMPCVVQSRSKRDTDGGLVLAGACAPALESATAALGRGSLARRSTVGGAANRGRTGVRDRTTGGSAGTAAVASGRTYAMRCAAGPASCDPAGAATGTKRDGAFVNTRSAAAIVMPDAAAVLAIRSALETGTARSRITRTFASASTGVNC